MSKIKLTDWFEIDEQEYLMYILRGYEIVVEHYVKVVWRLNGKRHREDGPAVIWQDGDKWWYRNGHKRSLNGPSVIWEDGNK